MTRALRLSPWARYPPLILLGIFAAFPLAYIARVALAVPRDVADGSPNWLGSLTLENFNRAISDSGFRSALVTSLLVGALSTLAVAVIATPAAYACAIVQFKGRRHVEMWILSTRMLPPVVVLVPDFLMFRSLHALDTVWAVLAMHTLLSLALVFFMMRSFFADLPRETIEAAYVEGASPWRTFLTVALPQVRPGLVAAAVLAFMFSWNELIFSLTVAGGATKTGPVAVLSFIAFQNVQIAPLMAAATTLMLPVAVLLVLMQKGLVRGLSFGAVKG